MKLTDIPQGPKKSPFGDVLNESELTEVFYGKKVDVLMPIIKAMMSTALRPVIYKLWKTSKPSVFALAAIKKHWDDGDKDPITTVSREYNIEVPMAYLRRLVYEAGWTDIPGASHKVGLMPGYAMGGDVVHESKGDGMAYHITRSENVESIKKDGLVPRIGINSRLIGEDDKAVHLFYNIDTAEDAVANWGMPDWDDEADLVMLAVNVRDINMVDDPAYPGEVGIASESIPPENIKVVDMAL